jgi:hypothetical protein
LTILTGACVALALVAITLAATASLATAEAAPAPARFAVAEDETVVSGTVVGVGDAVIGVQEADGTAPVAFPVAPGATLSRDGAPAVLAELRPNDPVHLTVDRATGTVRQIVAESAAAPLFQPSDRLAAIAFLGLVAGALALFARRRAPLAVAETVSARPARPARRLGLGDLSVSPFVRRRQPEYQS